MELMQHKKGSSAFFCRLLSVKIFSVDFLAVQLIYPCREVVFQVGRDLFRQVGMCHFCFNDFSESFLLRPCFVLDIGTRSARMDNL